VAQACSALTEAEDFARSYRGHPTRLVKQQASGVIETLETAGELPLGPSHL
jgi:hypothetical protein